MKTKLAIFALIVTAAFAKADDKPVDLTGADAGKFKSQLGHVVSLRGRLQEGMQGETLVGATPTNVVFYIIDDGSPGGNNSGSGEHLMNQQVRITGELKFRSFDNSKAKPTDQIMEDFYYMDRKHVHIEPLVSK